MKIYKNNITTLITLPVLLIGGFFVFAFGINAETVQYQIIDLESGWNIISTPKVLSSHEFSVSEISENFDIYLLSPSSVSGWKTMQEANQTEFQPLFSYFINNKTEQTQTLKFYYNDNLSPNQRLFDRSLNRGWNTIGIANTEYALKKGSSSADTNNPSRILYSTLDCVSDIIDFTADQSSLDSVKVGEKWTNKIATDVDALNDFRELKAYGVYVTADNCLYRGSQNINNDIVFSLSADNLDELSRRSLNQTLLIFNIDSFYDLTINSLTFIHDGTGGREHLTNFRLYDVNSNELLGTVENIDNNNNLIFQSIDIDILSGIQRKVKLIADIGSDAVVGENHVISLEKAISNQGTIDNLSISNDFNIKESNPGSLEITLADSPSGGNITGDEELYIKGQTGVTVAGFILTAGPASDIVINTIQLTAYITENTGAALSVGIDTNYVKDTVSAVYIYDKDTSLMVPGSSAKGFTSGTNYENVDFTGLSWVIPAGTSKTLLVKNDISSAAPASASTADTWIGYDILDADTDILAVDEDNNVVNATGDAPNPLAATVNFGVAYNGFIAIDGASDTPDKSLIVMGTNDNEVSKFKLTGGNEAFHVETFSVVLDDGRGIDSANRDNFSSVKLKYQTESQYGTSNWTISTGKTFGSTASLAFSFVAADRIYVPKDDNTYVTVLVSIAGYDGGNGAKSKVPFKMYNIDGSASSFKAYGAQSGSQLIGATHDADSADFNLHFVARSKPVFAKVSSTASNELARFSITAVGGDVVFDGSSGTEDDIASACLRFDVLASTTDTGSLNIYLYDWNENVLASKEAWAADGDGNVLDGTVTSVSFVFEEKDATVPSGTTKEFHVDLAAADVTDFLKTDEYIYLQLRNDDGGSLATGSMGFGDRDIVYGDATNEEGISGQGDPELRFGMPALIKNIGPLPITFTVIRGTSTP